MNKFLRFLGYVGVHLLVMIEVFLLSLAVTSPILNLVFGTLDAIQKIPQELRGRYFIAWLLMALIVWIPMYIYVEAKGHKDIKNINKKE